MIQVERARLASTNRICADMIKPELNIDPPQIAGVTFDVTRTLIACPRAGEIYHQVLERHGIATDPRQLDEMIPRVWRELACLADLRSDRFAQHPEGERGWWRRFVERVCEHLGTARPSRFAASELFHRFEKADAWEVYPEVASTLSSLREAGLRLAVISNWDHRLPTLLRNLDLDHFFHAIVFSAECGIEKPNPALFEHCLDRLGLEAQHTLHVGDHPLEDVEGAAAAGMWSLRVNRRHPGGTLDARISRFFAQAPESATIETGSEAFNARQ